MKVHLLIISLLLFSFSQLLGQEEDVIQVITKKITKTFPYNDGFEVNLEGSNAEVLVETWEKKEIYVQIELISKHPDKAVAAQDLEQMQYTLDRVKRKIYIRNYLATQDNVQTTAIIEANYIIKLPEDCPVYIKNQFGETNVRNLANQLRLFNEYGAINLQNVSGTVEMRTRFGDVFAKDLNGNFDIFARRSNLDLHNVVGNYNIEAKYGILNLWAGTGLIDLNIDASKADVNLFNIDPLTHQQQLLVQHGKINVPNGWQFNYEEDTPQIKKVTFKPNSEFYATVTISIAFGDLKIEGK